MQQDRREQHQVRQVFEQACALLAPYVASNDQVKTISNFAMAHMVRDQFPELTDAEVYLVISSVEKVHREERIQAILAKLK